MYPFKNSYALIFLGATLFILYLTQLTHWPPYLFGEEYIAITNSNHIASCLKNPSEQPSCLLYEIFSRYNKSHSWLLLALKPFINLFSLNVFQIDYLYKIIHILLSIIFILLAVNLYSKIERKHWLYCSIGSVFLCTVLISISRFKWHPYAMLASIYPLYFSLFLDTQDKILKNKYLRFSILIFMISFFFYIPSMLFLIPSAVLFIYHQYQTTKMAPLKKSSFFVLTLLLGTVFLITYFFLFKGSFHFRISEIINYSIFYNPSFFTRNLDNTKIFILTRINLASLALYVIGFFYICFLCIKKNKSILILFALLATEGVSNPDYLNFFNITFMITIMSGISIIFITIKKYCSFLLYPFIFLLVLNSYQEVFSFQKRVLATNYQGLQGVSQTQLAVTMEDIYQNSVDNGSNQICHHFPKKTIPDFEGGFLQDDFERYLVFYSKFFTFNFFSTLDDVKIFSQRNISRCITHYIYFNSFYSDRWSSNKLLICEIHYPLAKRYNSYYSVLRCQLR